MIGERPPSRREGHPGRVSFAPRVPRGEGASGLPTVTDQSGALGQRTSAASLTRHIATSTITIANQAIGRRLRQVAAPFCPPRSERCCVGVAASIGVGRAAPSIGQARPSSAAKTRLPRWYIVPLCRLPPRSGWSVRPRGRSDVQVGPAPLFRGGCRRGPDHSRRAKASYRTARALAVDRPPRG